MSLSHPPARWAVQWISPRLAIAISVATFGACFGIGLAAGWQQAGIGCGSPQRISVLGVLATNLALNGILMSGRFTLGLTTLFGAPLLLILTASTVGQTVQAYGWPGVFLLLPHGTLEVASWLGAMYVGLTGVRLPARTANAGRDHPAKVARWALAVLAATAIAALVERLWTSWYGPSLSCVIH